MIRKKPFKSKVINQDSKTKFRRSSAWKKLRDKVRKLQKLDPLTDKPLSKTYNLHHGDLDPLHYTDISDESHFIGLNSMSHDVLHWIYGDSRTRKNWRRIILNLIKLCRWMDTLNK